MRVGDGGSLWDTRVGYRRSSLRRGPASLYESSVQSSRLCSRVGRGFPHSAPRPLRVENSPFRCVKKYSAFRLYLHGRTGAATPSRLRDAPRAPVLFFACFPLLFPCSRTFPSGSRFPVGRIDARAAAQRNPANSRARAVAILLGAFVAAFIRAAFLRNRNRNRAFSAIATTSGGTPWRRLSRAALAPGAHCNSARPLPPSADAHAGFPPW